MADDLDLSSKTKEELLEMAKAMDIEGRSTMSRDDLEKAVKKDAGKPQSGRRISGDPDQGSARAVVYTDERVLSRGSAEQAPAGEGTADQSSLGGTITGPDPAPTGTGTGATSTGATATPTT